MMRSTDREWEKYGQLDPYFGVDAHDRFRSANLDDAARAEFFRSGAEHIDWVLATVRAHLDPAFRPNRALDFGCGVGRLVLPLARCCEEVVGVDVSESMLREARENCRRAGVASATLVASDDELSQVEGTFDLIHSVIVFQHIPPTRGMRILRALLDRLTPGGVGVLQFTYARRAAAMRRAVHWMRKKLPLVNGLVNVAQRRAFGYPLMQMNEYSLNRIFRLLQESGCDGMHLSFTDHGGHLGAMLFFQKQAVAPGVAKAP